MLRMCFVAAACVLVCLGSWGASLAQTASGMPPEQATPIWIEMERRLDAGDYVDVKAQTCGPASTLKSREYNTPTVLRFKNATRREVKYYWLDYDGKRSQERTLKAGESQNVRTYLTHPFMVVDASGACSAVYVPQAQPGVITIADRRE